MLYITRRLLIKMYVLIVLVTIMTLGYRKLKLLAVITRARHSPCKVDKSYTTNHSLETIQRDAALIVYFQTWDYYTLPDGNNISMNHIPEDDVELSAFRPVTSKQELNTYYELLEVVTSTCKANNFTCLLQGGSLLGSYRHHGIIPWDDDVDLMILKEEQENLTQVLNNVSEEYAAVSTDCCVKFYHTRMPKYTSFDWGWPFIDLIGYNRLSSVHVMGPPDTGDKIPMQNSLIWPTRKRKFGRLWIDAPGQGLKIIQKIYRNGWESVCKKQHYSHKYAKQLFQLDVNINISIFNNGIACERLMDYYPFVMRGNDSETCEEKLMLAGKEVGTG